MSRELARRDSAETALARHLEEQKALFVELNNRAVGKGRPAPYTNVGVAILTMQIAKRADGTFLVKAREERLDEVDWTCRDILRPSARPAPIPSALEAPA